MPPLRRPRTSVKQAFNNIFKNSPKETSESCGDAHETASDSQFSELFSDNNDLVVKPSLGSPLLAGGSLGSGDILDLPPPPPAPEPEAQGMPRGRAFGSKRPAAKCKTEAKSEPPPAKKQKKENKQTAAPTPPPPLAPPQPAHHPDTLPHTPAPDPHTTTTTTDPTPPLGTASDGPAETPPSDQSHSVDPPQPVEKTVPVMSVSPAVVCAPRLPPEEPKCSKCHSVLDPLRAQISSKGGQRWKRAKCNTRHVQLIRIFGGWPSPEFRSLTESQQVAFWQEEVAGTKALERLVVDTLTNQRIERRSAAQEGQCLPLSVYAQQGYNVSDILNKCQDKEVHPILGDTFKVNIHTTSHATVQEEVRQEVLERKFRPSKGRRSGGQSSGVGDDGPVEKSSSSEASSNSSSDSTSSSSSSSDRKKKKKNKKRSKKAKRSNKHSKKSKKNKKNKKDNKPTKAKPNGKDEDSKAHSNLRRKTELANQKVARGIQQLCRKSLAKLASALFTLQNLVVDPMLQHVPMFAQKAAQRSLKELEKIEEEAKAKMVSDSPGEVSWTAESLCATCKTAEESIALLSGLLATAKKHAK